MTIQVTNNDWQTKPVKITDRTKTKHGVPTFEAMVRKLNK